MIPSGWTWRLLLSLGIATFAMGACAQGGEGLISQFEERQHALKKELLVMTGIVNKYIQLGDPEAEARAFLLDEGFREYVRLDRSPSDTDDNMWTVESGDGPSEEYFGFIAISQNWLVQWTESIVELGVSDGEVDFIYAVVRVAGL